MTCPQCGRSGAPIPVAPVARVSQAPDRPHYSGASRETREYLARSWDDIVDRVAGKVANTSVQNGIQRGDLIRREAS